MTRGSLHAGQALLLALGFAVMSALPASAEEAAEAGAEPSELAAEAQAATGEAEAADLETAEQDEAEEVLEEEEAEPGAFAAWRSGASNRAKTGLNGMLTFPADPVALAADGDELFADAPGAVVTAPLLGFGTGMLQGFYRLFMGLSDVLFAPIPQMPMLSPVPRHKLLDFQHDEE